MTWSYSPDQLATKPVYAVRLLIGDTVDCDPQMQDEEIAYFISKRSSLYGAAAECCKSLSVKFSRSVDTTAASTKAYYSQLGKAYKAQSILFEAKAAASGAGTPYVGGVSISDIQNNAMNIDRVPSNFTIGMMDNLLPVAPVGPGTSEDNEIEENNE